MINKKRIAKTAVALLTTAMLIQAVPAHADSVHVAKEGDTFYTLSKQYGVAINTLVKANNDISPYNIYGGLKITIPGKANNVAAAAQRRARPKRRLLLQQAWTLTQITKLFRLGVKHSITAKL
ncbi:LysM domain-containing protein [Paenibacillus amylolyticus]|nr:LysM domain-containing protein [Paenibacillus amylolyticus]